MKIRSFEISDRNAVVRLWTDCGLVKPWNDPFKDIDRKLFVNPEWFLVGEDKGRIIATCMAGYEGHRGWINYLAVDPSARHQGAGRCIMAAAEKLLLEAGCPKINLQVRTGNQRAIDFYNRIGFSQDDVVSMGKRLIPDT